MRRPRPALLGVALATAIGLLGRLWALGARPAHTAEARLGVAVLDVMAAGSYQYAPALEGPFLFHLQRLLFGLFGASDATMRLGVALVTALLPASAWLFRERLSEAAVVALAGLFAGTPVVLYYSRFLGNDALLATFAVLTLGLVVRAGDTGRHGYLYAAGVTAALGAATTWYVVLYAGTWIAAGALVFDYRLFADVTGGTPVREGLAARVDDWRGTAERWAAPLALSAAAFVVVTAFLYAPRPALWEIPSAPGTVFTVLGDGTVGAWETLHGHWIQGRPTTGGYFLPYFEALVGALAAGAAVPVGFGVLGFVVDRYQPGGGRDLVAFATFWGATGLLVYAAVAPEPAPWNAVHLAVPLAIPAAVGLGAVYRFARNRLAEDRRELAALAAVVLLLAGGQVAATAVATSLASPADAGPLVYAGQSSGTATAPGESDPHVGQPAVDLDGALAPVYEVAAGHEGLDAVVYGSRLDGDAVRPLDWYLRSHGVASEHHAGFLTLPDALPPVVIAATGPDGTGGDAAEIADRLDPYDRVAVVEVRRGAGDEALTVAVFVRSDR